MTDETKEKPAEKRLGRPPSKSSEDRRERILQAAGEQFNEHSFSEVSMAKIARAAGITGAAIYNYFGSKDELFWETVKHRIVYYNDLISTAVDIPGSWKDRLNGLIEVAVKLQENNHGFPLIAAVVQTRLNREPEKFQEIRGLRNESSLIFRSVVAEAVDAGDLPKDTNIAIAGDLLMAIMAGAIPTVSFYNPSEDDLQAIFTSIKALLGTNG